ncbi:efflux RND transporter periplasmic adaptor subunit [Rhodoferax sp.]|jgi:RND family efflux transporter MFP subunit|uniref:efflux RND transporter periplasmic adaptor subunit n=1 Tax=Rhodoferax sp. TaxID=50421 RepID=UPI0037837932
MKLFSKWTVVLLVALLLIAGGWRFFAQRSAAKAALDAQQASQKVQQPLQLAASETVQAQKVDLLQVLQIAGPLRASNTVMVKARVAGELQGLVLREGDLVQAGTVVATVDSTEFTARLRQAQQQAESAKAQVDIAKRAFDNNQSLVQQGFISKTALDTSIATLAANEANHRAALAGVDVAQKALGDTVLRAPISGHIGQRLAQPGERVSVDARIVEIVDLSRLELEASLDAADSLSVRTGQHAELSIEGAAQPVRSTVVRINPSAAAGSRAVLAYLRLEPQEGLRQGLFAQGTLQVGSMRVLAVPLSAVRTDKPTPYVQIAVQGAVVHRPVRMGRKGLVDGQPMVEVQGVDEGADVLVGALGALREGTPVAIAAGAK